MIKGNLGTLKICQNTKLYKMLKVLDINQKNSLKKLEFILSKRKLSQNENSLRIKKILAHVKKNGDTALINAIYNKLYDIGLLDEELLVY